MGPMIASVAAFEESLTGTQNGFGLLNWLSSVICLSALERILTTPLPL